MQFKGVTYPKSIRDQYVYRVVLFYQHILSSILRVLHFDLDNCLEKILARFDFDLR